MWCAFWANNWQTMQNFGKWRSLVYQTLFIVIFLFWLDYRHYRCAKNNFLIQEGMWKFNLLFPVKLLHSLGHYVRVANIALNTKFSLYPSCIEIYYFVWQTRHCLRHQTSSFPDPGAWARHMSVRVVKEKLFALLWLLNSNNFKIRGILQFNTNFPF